MRLIPKQGEPIDLGDLETTVLGRQPGRGHAIKDATVSREHARLFRRDGEWRVADLNSSNGTFVNGRKVSVSPIRAGDTLRLGEVELTVELAAAAPAPAASDDAGGEDGGIVLEDPAAELETASNPVSEQTMVAQPTPMFQNRPSAKPTSSGLSERSQALLRDQQVRGRSDGTMLAQDVGQYSGGRQLVMIALAIAVAVGLFFGVMKLTESVVPAGDDLGESTPAEETDEP